MSYARFSEDSDVYVFLSVDGWLECCGCGLGGTDRFRTTDAMLAHLREHVEAGQCVPDYCFSRLEAERDENDIYMSEGGES